MKEFLPTGTVTFLFTDIQGSTPLWERQPEKMAEALQIHHTVLRKAIETHGGAVFKTVGDAFQAAFSTAPQALQAAIEGQRALQAANWNELGPFKVRMGLHTGEAQLDPGGDEYAVSHTKNRVARIMSAAHGGQVLLSQETADLVNRLLPEGVTLKDLGEHRLKGMEWLEQIHQANISGLPNDFPPLSTSITHPNNLPVQLTSFIGREKEIATVRDLLASHRLVTLTGSGGTGKSRLSLQVAEQVLDQYPNGAWLVELAPLSDPELIPNSVATTLKLPETPGKPLLETLVDYLRAKRLLLILDNCEHLLEACAELADHLLHACPDLTILATSREFLGVEGEVPYLVPPLGLPDVRQRIPPEQMTEYDAVSLFLERARVALPGFNLTEKNALSIVQMVSRLDGIPLAIELAASRLRLLSLDQLLQRLEDAFRLLTGGSRSKLPRHQTLRASIDWSYNLLSEGERILLRRQSVFAGGWTLEASERVCAQALEDCQPLYPEDILELLSGLVDKSLILAVSSADGLNRFKMLETIRQYSHERLVYEKEAAAVRTCHMAYYLEWVETLEPKIRSREQIETLNLLDSELDNLRLALEWALQTDVDKELRLASALMWFWHIRSRHTEGIDWLERGLAGILPRLSDAGLEKQLTIIHAKALCTLGFCYKMVYIFRGGESFLDNATNVLKASLVIYHTVRLENHPQIQRGIAWALLWLGESLHWASESRHQAEQNFQEALRLFRGLGDAHGVAESLFELANLEIDLQQRRKIHQEQLAIDQANGDVEGTATALHLIGIVNYIDGVYQQALLDYEKSLLHYQQVNNPEMIGRIWSLMGISAMCSGDLPRADLHSKQSITICRDLGNDYALANRLFLNTFIAIYKGNFELASELNTEAWAIARRNNSPQNAGYAGYWSARLARLKGDFTLARQHVEEMLSQAGMPVEVKMLANLELGFQELENGDLVQAGHLWRDGVRLLESQLEMAWFLQLFEALAYLAATEKQYERAVMLSGTRWSRGAQYSLSPAERADRQAGLAAARQALGGECFEQLYEEGRTMSLEQAVVLALEEIHE